MRLNKISVFAVMLTVLLSGILIVKTYGQELSKAELEKRAEDFLKKEKFDKAATDFKILHDMYPKEPRYAYKLGCAYLGANQELESAIELLKFTATRNYGNDSYFHLGRAYHLTYQFDEAIMAFRTFKKTAKRRDLAQHDIEYWLCVAQNAKASVLMAQKVNIEETRQIKRNSPESGFSNAVEGKYIYVPDELKSSADIKNDYHSMLFLSENIQVGDYLYFDCLTGNRKQHSDIYRVKRLTAGDFSLPEPLSANINTNYDERYPYFDKETSTLYFSSNNINTIGGLDIFSTKYDSATVQWTTPERLNFPINSVHDDFLYTISSEADKAIFLSDRSNTLSDYTAYSMLLEDEVKYELPVDHDDMLTLALLSPNAMTINSENKALADNMDQVKSGGPGTVTSEWKQKETYFDALIKEALILQAQSDSLEWMATDLKAKAEKADDILQKQALLASMTTLEQESKRLEALATEKFTEAEKLQSPGYANSVADNEVLKEGDVLDNGIKVYSFNTATKERKNRRNKASDDGIEAARKANREISEGFSIMQSSPYSENNPIPIASLPGGLIYRIQLGSFNNNIPDNTFGGLSPVSKEEVSNSTKYYVGYFKSITNARQALNKIKKYGYPDAFIVSYYEREKISVQKAREIEFAER